jgi:GNAT superfamily N-acetyltransferase
VSVLEISDKAQIDLILSPESEVALEAIDENALGVPGIVTVFSEDEPRPANRFVVRWAQSAMGLRNAAQLFAGRLTGLEDVVGAVPKDRGAYDVVLPFWASPALAQVFRTEVTGAEAVYVLEPGQLKGSPVVRQCTRVTEPELLRPKFRKLAEDAPAYVLSLRGELTSVAVVTHLRHSVARIDVYTVEEGRRRGFGRGVLTALAEELLALEIRPTVRVDLGNEPAVRLVEGAGFVQRAAFLKARADGALPGPLSVRGP